MEFKKVNRRLFLTSSAMSLLGYTACVAVPEPKKGLGRGRDDLPKPIGTPAARSEIGRRIEAATPAGNRIFFKNPQAYSPESERFMDTYALDCDLLVAGGGLAGVSAARSLPTLPKTKFSSTSFNRLFCATGRLLWACRIST